MHIKNPRKHKQADTNLLLTKRHGGITHSLERFEPGMVAKMKCGTVLVVWRDADHTGKMCRRCRKPTGRHPYLVRMKPRTMAALKRAAKPKTVGEYLDATYAP